jgi:hypothetical protein
MKLVDDRWQGFAGLACRCAQVSAAALLLLVFATAHAADEDEDEEKMEDLLPKESAELARKFAAVMEWKGFFQSSESGTINWTGFYSHGSETVDNSSHGHFHLKRSKRWSGEDVRRGVFTWGGDSWDICGEQTVSLDMQKSKWEFRGTGSEQRMQSSGTLPMTGTEFTLWLPSHRQKGHLVHVHPGAGSGGKKLLVAITGRSVWDESKGNGTSTRRTRSLDENSERDGFVNWYSPVGDAASAAWYQVVRAGPGVLVFPYERTSRADTEISTPTLTRRSRVILCPVYDDLELEVAIEGYAKWRPEGSIEKPQEPGNSLVARATLKSKTGAVKGLPDVRRFRFELLDTSREPGVCLNWPLQAKDEDYDLRLTSDLGGKLSDADQKLIVSDAMKDDKERPYAETKINSYDFGGRATLLVVCDLEDGRELMGVIKGEKGEEDLVRLPKMNGPDWVAENWRKEKDVEKLPALDDEEKVEGQKHKGDGFTLYEEYRGWVEKGKHIEGDPKKKDFFVRNLIGADAKGGIALFERVSKLRVHSQLRASEIIYLPIQYIESESNAKGERIMNLNHRDGPHRVDQHGVVMINASGFRSSGGAAKGVINDDKTNRAFRPGKTYEIRLEERGRRDGVFSQHSSTADYNLSERDAAFAYDRGVAHELLHSVGVDHHGEGQEPKMFYFQGAGDPMNTAHRPRFVRYMPPSRDDFASKKFGKPAVWSDFDRGPTVTFRWEDTGEDVAQSLSADFERELAAERNDPQYEQEGIERAAQFPQYGKDAAFWQVLHAYNRVSSGDTNRGLGHVDASSFNKFVTIGRDHQADSGNELCLMRYYFANAYPVDAAETAFYLVRRGGNRAGRELCTSPEGTGANGHDHKPKSRFNDSAPGRGGCFQYICPNDAIPPRTL